MSEATGELREQIAAWEFARRAPARYWGSGALDAEEVDARSAADEILALPALAPLLDAQAAVKRVEALADEFDANINWREWGVGNQIRRALGVPS